jgi:hypothetical protein
VYPLTVLEGTNATYAGFWADQYILPVPNVLINLGWILAAFEILWGVVSLLLAPGWSESGCSHPIWKSVFDQRLRKVFVVLGMVSFYPGEHINFRMTLEKISSVRHLGILLLLSLWLWGKQTADNYNDFIRNAKFANTGVVTPVPPRIASSYLSGLQGLCFPFVL